MKKHKKRRNIVTYSINIVKVLGVIMIIVILFLIINPTFGKNPQGENLEKIKTSRHYNGTKFYNLVPTKIMLNDSEYNQTLATTNNSLKKPTTKLPSATFNKKNIIDDSYTWFGHSSVLIKTNNTTIFIDPVFNRASPIPFFLNPFKIEHPIRQEDLPSIDAIVISHNHYDHLDYKAIKKFGNNVEKYFVPLGLKTTLAKWGIEEERIEELDWYEQTKYHNITFTLTPTRHFSGRGLRDRFATLWGGWIITSKTQNIYFSGDGGYTDEFKKIGDTYGPFDISFIENGQYNARWSQIHLFPEQSVQVAQELKSKLTMPVHWGKFSLAPHNWDEAIIRFTKESKNKNLTITTPLIGETFTTKNYSQSNWWE